MSVQLKMGLVGAGAISQSYAQAFEGIDCGRLVAVADVRPEAARALKDFATSDRIRGAVSAEGIAIVDSPEGPRWSRKLAMWEWQNEI